MFRLLRRFLALLIAIPALILGLLPGVTSPVGAAGHDGSHSFNTHLFPGSEVPPLSGQGHGWSTWTVPASGDSVSYRVLTAGIGDIVGAHLHHAPAGSNGPVVVPLDISGAATGSMSGTFTAADLEGPLAGGSIDDLVTEIEAGMVYVNVHTADIPSGAIRGQLAAPDTAPPTPPVDPPTPPTGSTLDVFTVGAPVDPTGRTPGARTDFIVGLADFDPSVPGIGMAEGGTIRITLPDDFQNTGRDVVGVGGKAGCMPPAVRGCSTAVIVQGWPQSPVAPLPAVELEASTNTIVVTAAKAWPAGGFDAPGPKAVHLMLFGFKNPTALGDYEITVEVQPDPASSDTMTGTGTVTIGYTTPVLAPNSQATPSPIPFANTLYQRVGAGDEALPMAFYMWDRSARAIVGAQMEMTSLDEGLITDASGNAIGSITITAPAGAAGYALMPQGPSEEAAAFVTGNPVGRLVAGFKTAPGATGMYELRFELDGADPLIHRIEAGPATSTPADTDSDMAEQS